MKEKEKKKMGRPFVDGTPRNKRVSLLLTENEKKALENAAKKKNMTLSRLIAEEFVKNLIK